MTLKVITFSVWIKIHKLSHERVKNWSNNGPMSQIKCFFLLEYYHIQYVQHCFVSFWNFEYACVHFIRSLKYTSAIYFSDIIYSCQQLKALFKISAEGPPFTHILWLGKNRVTRTVVDPLLTQKSPIIQGSGNCVSDFV